MKTGAIIQTRMGSTRLPGKVMMELCGEPVIFHVIERMKQANLLDDIIIATTVAQEDDIIVGQAYKCGVKSFRGSTDDVLARYYFAAKENDLDVIVRITSDCPLIDPFIINQLLQFYSSNKYDIVSNAGDTPEERTYPRGLDVEIFSYQCLEDAFLNSTELYQREHVTPYMYEGSYSVFYYKNNVNHSKYRWTLDTQDDFMLISKIYNYFYKGKHDFYFKDILRFIQENPELTKLNEHVEQKKLKEA